MWFFGKLMVPMTEVSEWTEHRCYVRMSHLILCIFMSYQTNIMLRLSVVNLTWILFYYHWYHYHVQILYFLDLNLSLRWGMINAPEYVTGNCSKILENEEIEIFPLFSWSVLPTFLIYPTLLPDSCSRSYIILYVATIDTLPVPNLDNETYESLSR